MAQLAPVVKQDYTDEERAVIAGYLLRQRAGTLQAIASSKRAIEITTDIGPIGQLRYYEVCEAYSRFLLYGTGYQVQKNMMYGGQEAL